MLVQELSAQDIQSANTIKEVSPKCNICTLNCTLEEIAVLNFLREQPKATQKEIAAHIGKSERTVKTMVRRLYLAERVILVYWSVAAQAAYIHKAPDAAETEQSVDKIYGAKGVHTVKVGTVHAFGNACGMNHIIERPPGKTVLKLSLTTEIKFYEVYARIGKILARAGFTHCRPYLHAAAQCLFDDKPADKARGSSYQYLVAHLYFYTLL